MDPFIEGCGLWEDFHTHLIEKIYEVLADTVPGRYTVRTGERAYVILAGADGDQTHLFKPDVGITASRVQPEAPMAAATVALADAPDAIAPVAVRAFVAEEFRETFVEIRDSETDNQLVTCIELLSPTNKRRGSDGWDLYLRKRQGLLLAGNANLVEIDLLRGGQRLPMLDPWPGSPYTLLVARKQGAPTCLVWPAFSLRPLDSIPIPLLSPDPDVQLGLQPMIDGIYARSRYGRSIDYARTLTPPLNHEEAVWLDQHLA